MKKIKGLWVSILLMVSALVSASPNCPKLEDVSNIQFDPVITTSLPQEYYIFEVTGLLTSENKSWFFETYVKTSDAKYAKNLVKTSLINHKLVLTNDNEICLYNSQSVPWGINEVNVVLYPAKG